MAIHSHIRAWRIPWTEEPDGLQSVGLQRVRHNKRLSARAPTHTPAHTIGLHRVIASLIIHTGHFGDEEGSSPGQCVNIQNNAQHRVRLIIIIIEVLSFIPYKTRNTS